MIRLFKSVLFYSVVIVILATLAVVGHVFGVPFLYTWGLPGVGMAFQTAIAVTLLSLAVLALSGMVCKMAGVITSLHQPVTKVDKTKLL